MTTPTTPTTESVSANGIEIAYETFGEPSATPLLLVMGLATQMLAWPVEFCTGLADRGYYVIRYDNRDVGLSTHLHSTPPPSLAALLRRDHRTATYTIDDLADDAAGLLEALEIDSAHVVGVSMGGMIAQTLAFRHSAKVRSLTSIMSTPNPRAGRPSPRAALQLIKRPARSRAQAIERAVNTYRVIGSPGFALDEGELRAVAAASFDRAYDPAGAMRQLAAISASPDRVPGLRTVKVPTLVIHGEADQLVGVNGGRATAAAVQGAELLTVKGMGHNLPRELWPLFIDRITDLAKRTDVA